MKYPKLRKLQNLSGYLFQLINQGRLFEMNKREKNIWDKKVQVLTAKINKLETEIEKFKVNKFQRRRRPTEAQRISFLPHRSGSTMEDAGERVEKLLLKYQ